MNPSVELNIPMAITIPMMAATPLDVPDSLQPRRIRSWMAWAHWDWRERACCSIAESAVIATESTPPIAARKRPMAGWSLCLDAEKPSWFTVDVVVSATQLRLYLKRATTLTAVGKAFRLCPPPFVDAQTGTLGSRDASGNVTFAHAKTQARRLWAGYRYTPPLWLTFRRYFVIGVSSSGSIHQRSLTAMWSTNPPCQNTWPDS